MARFLACVLVLNLSGLAAAQVQFSELGRQWILSPVAVDYANAVAVGDVDGDGWPDVVAAGYGFPIHVFLGDGFGGVQPGVAQTPQHFGGRLTLIDLDGDGDLDLVPGWDSQGIAVYVNDGRGNFSPGWRSTPTVFVWRLAMADFDGDRDVDILAGTVSGSCSVRLYLNDGSGRFVDGTAGRVAVSDCATALAAGDVDGDGDVDALLGNAVPRERLGARNGLLRNDGTAHFTYTPIGSFDTYPNDLRLVDVDIDGDLDLIEGNFRIGADPGQTRLYVNDGTGQFSDVTASRLPPDSDLTRRIAVADFDQDADVDIFIANMRESPPPRGQDRLYLNDGRGFFSDATHRVPPDRSVTQDVCAVDFDLEGDVDLLSPVMTPNLLGADVNLLRIYLNLHQHLGASPAPARGQTLALEMFAKPGYGTGAEAAIPWLSLGLSQPPLRVVPFGLFHLDLASTVSGPLLAIPPSGSATYSLPVPNDPRLAGLTLYGQAAILHANVADWRFSPRTRSVIQ